jgi:hypothetical protein
LTAHDIGPGTPPAQGSYKKNTTTDVFALIFPSLSFPDMRLVLVLLALLTPAATYGRALSFKPPVNGTTNAQRMARGLAPLKPRLASRVSHAARSAPSGFSLPIDGTQTVQSAGIIGAFAADGTFIGFYNPSVPLSFIFSCLISAYSPHLLLYSCAPAHWISASSQA